MCHDVTTPPAISMLVAARESTGCSIRTRSWSRRTIFSRPRTSRAPSCTSGWTTGPSGTSIKHYYKLGRAGVCHALLPEQGHIRPGEVIVGGDSHTCTYGAFAAFSTGIGSTDLAAAIATGKLWFKVPASMKFVLNGSLPHGRVQQGRDPRGDPADRHGRGAVPGDGVRRARPWPAMSMEARMTMTNMAIEAGAKNGIIGFDEVTKAYLDEHAEGQDRLHGLRVRPGCRVCRDGDVRLLEAGADGGLAAPAQQRQAHRRVRGPGDGPGVHRQLHQRPDRGPAHRGQDHEGQARWRSARWSCRPRRSIWKQATDERLVDVFYDAGCVISAPTCGACLGGFMGILAAGEKCVSTTNRNFVGRMGSPKSEVYLASPATAAASAVEGKLSRSEKVSVDEITDYNSRFSDIRDLRNLCRLRLLIWQRPHVYKRDHINTDEIIPARYLNTDAEAELAKHCMEDLDVAVRQEGPSRAT